MKTTPNFVFGLCTLLTGSLNFGMLLAFLTDNPPPEYFWVYIACDLFLIFFGGGCLIHELLQLRQSKP